MKDSGVEWLGAIPAHWTGLPLKRWVAAKITDGPHETPELLPNGVDFISAEAVSEGKIDFEKRRGFISPELHTQYSRKCKPVRDDILICKSGATTGKLAKVDTDMGFSIWSPLAIVRVDLSRINPRFLEITLGADYVQNQIKRTWSAGTQPNISMGDLERLFVVAPSLEEQARILAFIDKETKGFSQIIARVREAVEHLRELRAALISAAVTGRIDVRGGGSVNIARFREGLRGRHRGCLAPDAKTWSPRSTGFVRKYAARRVFEAWLRGLRQGPSVLSDAT